jgi:hypothetical protein
VLESHPDRGKEALAIKIDNGLLEQACKEIIETILFCLPNAYKGTVYRIGKPPKMIAKRITSSTRPSFRSDGMVCGETEELDSRGPEK